MVFKHTLGKVILSAMAVLAAVYLALVALPTGAHAAPLTPTPPFTQCPSIGASPSCAILIVFNADGTVSILTDGSVGPFDGIEDTLLGVQNDTGVFITNVRLSSSQAIFGLDGDGLCTFISCSWPHPTKYEGPDTSFSITDNFNGKVNFTGNGGQGLAAGASTYFSLEEHISGAQITIPKATLTYTGDKSQDFNDVANLSANLVDASTNAPIVGATVNFTMGSQSCSATTDASGNASCSITINQAPGSYTVTANFPSNGTYQGASDSAGFTVTQEETSLAYNGATSSDFNDPATLSAVLTEDGTTPLAGRTISFTMASESCSAATDATGTASCSITPSEAAGAYTVSANFAGDTNYVAASASQPFNVTLEETTTHITNSANVAASGGSATLSANLTEDGTTAIAGRTLTLTLGSHSCTGTTNASGDASCTVSGLNTTTDLGPQTETANFAGDTFYKPSSDTLSVIVFAFLGNGSFVIGDNSAAASGTPTQTFWGAQWAKLNSLSGGAAPSAFKGFALNTSTNPPSCGGTWSTDPGNSAPPPAGPLPSYMAVIVASGASQSGSQISGNIVHIVIVKVAPGYAADPGHAGTGTIVGTFC